MSIGRRRLLVYLVIIVSLLMAVNLIKDITSLGSADRRLAAAGAELKQAQQRQEELKRSVAKAADGFWRESQIRNVLKMAKPEEVIVVIPEEVVKAGKAVEAVKAEEEESNLQKWRQVFGF